MKNDDRVEGRAPAALESIRRIVPGVAWLIAMAVGGMVAPKADLLDAVLRSGVVFVGTWVLCLAGTACIGWILTTPPPAPILPPTPTTQQESETESHEAQ